MGGFNINKMRDKINKKSSAIQEELVSYRRHLHANPEIDMDLEKTQKYIMRKLKEMGYNPEICGGSGVLALAGGKKPGKTFLIRGDMDALPIREETDLPYSSKNDYMHACGHDMHTTMMLGAASILKDMEDEIEGIVKLMFQPAEETLKGAKAMIEDGILENPKVDAAMTIHVLSGIPVKAGTIIAPKQGIATSASDWFEIHIKGKGGHGARPDETVDPINIAAHTHIALQAINSRELPVDSKVALTVGKLISGEISNVIPDTALLEGTIRTFNPLDREFIPKRIREISEGIAKTFRGSAKVKIIEGCPSVINNGELLTFAEKSIEEIFNEEIVDYKELGNEGSLSVSEDFGFLSDEIPTLMLLLGSGNSEEGYTYPIHHPKVRFDESVLSKGAGIYSYMAMNWLENN